MRFIGSSLTLEAFLKHFHKKTNGTPNMEIPLLSEIQPLLTIASVIANTSSLVEDGIKPDFEHLLLPSLVTTYGGPIVANALYSRFSFTRNNFLTYFLGFILSLYLHSSKLFMFLIKELPLLSKVLSSISVVESPENNDEMFPWILVCTFAGIILKNLTLKKSMKMTFGALFDIVALNIGLFLVREREIHPLAAAVLVILLNFAGRAKRFIKNLRETKQAKEIQKKVQITLDSSTSSQTKGSVAKRTPRRKASVANVIGNKGIKM